MNTYSQIAVCESSVSLYLRDSTEQESLAGGGLVSPGLGAGGGMPVREVPTPRWIAWIEHGIFREFGTQ